MFRLNLFLFLCLSTVFALELKHLCEEGSYHHNYEHVKFNSFHRLKLKKDLGAFSSYLTEEAPIRDVQEEVLTELFSNRLDLKHFAQKFFSGSGIQWTSSRSSFRFLSKLRNPMDKLAASLRKLNSYCINDDLLNKEELKEKIESLNKQLNETQTNPFQNKGPKFYYYENIATLDGVTMKRNQKIYLDENANATLHISLFIPLLDQNWMADENCYNLSSLPPFYGDLKKQSTKECYRV